MKFFLFAFLFHLLLVYSEMMKTLSHNLYAWALHLFVHLDFFTRTELCDTIDASTTLVFRCSCDLLCFT